MNSVKIEGLGYKQIFENTELAKKLCDNFNIKINEDFIGNIKMKKILNETKR